MDLNELRRMAGISENASDEKRSTFTIVHGSKKPTDQHDKVYTIVEGVTRDEARQLATSNLSEGEQKERYIIETIDGKSVPGGYNPRYINPEKQRQQEQKKQSQLNEAAGRHVEQSGESQHNWKHATLYENLDRDRMLELAGSKKSLTEAAGTEIKFKRVTKGSDGSSTAVYLSEDGREHYPVTVTAGVPQSVVSDIMNSLPDTMTWKK